MKYAILLSLAGNLHHTKTMMPTHFRFTQAGTKEPGMPVLNAIQIVQAGHYLHASIVMNIIRLQWIMPTQRFVTIHTTVLLATDVTLLAEEEIE